MLKAVGFSDADLARPLIGVANTWIEIGPCNYHLKELAADVKAGIREAGGTPLEFNTVSISDGITMGTAGMKASLVSREVIADSIELVARGNLFDGLVVLVGCDKTIPGAVMALARLDIPGTVLYGGSIAPGSWEGRDVTIQDVFEAVGAHAAGRLDAGRLKALEDRRLPGCGGVRRPVHREHDGDGLRVSRHRRHGQRQRAGGRPARRDVCARIGRLVMDLVDRDLRPSRIITRPALENAIAGVMATGGSTNAVLHLLAIAREAGVPLTIDDFNPVNDRIPLIADLKPGGRFVANDLYRAGGIALVARRLLEGGLLHGDAIDRHRPIDCRGGGGGPRDARPGGGAAARQPDQADRRPRDPQGQPRARRLRGEGRRLHAPRAHGAGARLRQRGGRVRRRRRRRASAPATSSSSATKARPAGPACARCWPSRRRSSARASATRWPCSPTAASRARRAGLMAGHVAPEAARGGPIAAVRDGDPITIDIAARELRLDVADDEVQRRLAAWAPPAPAFTTGVMAKYARLVSSASEGAVTG